MSEKRINTAVLLAAGMGNRLRPFTDNKPKCMVEVGGKPLLAHTMDALEQSGFDKLVVVTGYKEEVLREFIENYQISMKVIFVHNEIYDETNNIYSLWLAFNYLNNGFALIESDIILESQILKEFTTPNRIALDIYDQNKHTGTTASVSKDGYLENLYLKHSKKPTNTELYKTVNIYSFCPDSGISLFNKIDELIKNGDVNSFYELALIELIKRNEISLEMVNFNTVWWDEIDTPDDLERVEMVYLNSN